MMSIFRRLPFISLLLLLGLVFVFGFAVTGYSEDCRDNSDIVPGPAAPDPYYRAANEWTADTGGELDLYMSNQYHGCGTAAQDNAIDFTITIDQAISGTASVLLTLSTWDVDYTATGSHGNPEIDKVYINGYYLGNLTGSSDAWSINSFTVPIAYVNAPGSNAIKVEIDTLNTPNGDSDWCVKVDYGTISLSGSTSNGVTLDGCQDTAVDTDGNGKYDRLEIDVYVTASASGSFNLNGALYDSANHLIGWAQTTKSLTGGSNILTLEFDGEEISCRQANGPYTLKNVTVYNTSNTSVRAFKSQLCSTSPYTYTQFEACSSAYPLVITTNPVDGASGVSTGTTVSATFNMDMNASTLTTSTFTVTSASSPFAISGTVSYAAGTKTVTLTPGSALTANTMYTATLTTDVKSSSGSALPYTYTWSFTTGGGSSGGSCYCYYIPYYKDGNYSGTTFWGGVGLSNMSLTQDAGVVVTIYGEDGTVLGGESETIPAGGQKSFLAGYGQVGTEGWMLVSSDQPILGLCFVGTLGNNNYMADIPIATSKATSLLVPHVAQTNMWDTYILMCNPNSSASTVTLTFVGTGGQADTARNYSIPAMGSKKVSLADIITGGTSSGGKVTISATQGVAAFALYTNLKFNGKVYAGIAAVDPSELGDACTCSTPAVQTGGLTVTVKSATTGSALSGASVAIGGSSGTTNASGVYTFSNVSAGSGTLTTSLSGYITNTQTVSITAGTTTQITVALSPQLAAGETRIVLTWGASPSDLDSHLTGPDGAGGRFHVYYSNKTPSGAGANLDVDDTSSYGPETVTITQQRSGTYSYYIHDYSNRSSTYSNAMAQSGAKVEVYRGSGLIATYSVPSGAGTLWYVFDMDGTSGTITQKNQMLYESSPTGTNIRAGGAELNLFWKLPKK